MQLRTEVEIDASADSVWNVLSDAEHYHEWNPFIVQMRGNLIPGESIDVTIALPDGSESSFRPTLLRAEPGQELRWRGKIIASWLFTGEHFFELKKLESGRCRLVHGEDFSGLLTRFLGKKLGQTARGFVMMNDSLKKRCESAGSSPG